MNEDTKRMEKEATAFAMELLMPRKFVKEYIKNDHNGVVEFTDNIQMQQIANKFDVDVAVITARLIDLGY